MVMRRVVDIAKKKPEIKGQCEYDKECKYDFFQIHV
jgi:hypothetical protein